MKNLDKMMELMKSDENLQDTWSEVADIVNKREDITEEEIKAIKEQLFIGAILNNPELFIKAKEMVAMEIYKKANK